MPCMDTAPEVTAREQAQERRQLGQMLCAALRCIDEYEIEMPAECVKWWKEHQKEDEARERQIKKDIKIERQRQDALDKLKKSLSKKELRLIAESLRRGDLL